VYFFLILDVGKWCRGCRN